MGLFGNAKDNPAVLAQSLKMGRTDQQKAYIDYFLSAGGCMSKKSKVTDAMYVAAIKRRLEVLNLDVRALEKLGVDEDQVNEIEPITFASYDFIGEGVLSKVGKDGKARASSYQVTKLYFSGEQLYVYQITFSMINNTATEVTKEFFYKDVVSYADVESISETMVQNKGGCFSAGKPEWRLLKKAAFRINCPGDYFEFSISASDKVASSLLGLKSRLREKKGE